MTPRQLMILLGITAMICGCASDSARGSFVTPAASSSEIVQQGQALWHRPGNVDLAGELVLIHRADGSRFVQFSKPPIPVVTGQCSGNRWSVDFPPNRHFAGRGTPPERLIFLHLAEILGGRTPGGNWIWTRTEERSWRLANRRTGEFVEGYLTP